VFSPSHNPRARIPPSPVSEKEVLKTEKKYIKKRGWQGMVEKEIGESQSVASPRQKQDPI
jgi:hypothetical protein